MFCQIFLSPQVKRCAIITYKHGMYEMPYELLNDLRLSILGNSEIQGTYLIFMEIEFSTQSSCQKQHFVNPSKKLLKNRN